MTDVQRFFSDAICTVCLNNARKRNPDVLGCPWLSIDNDICDELKALILQVYGTNSKECK